jgi:hypothetical protein
MTRRTAYEWEAISMRVVAQHPSGLGVTTSWSEDEKELRYMMKEARDRWPEEEGWNHKFEKKEVEKT